MGKREINFIVEEMINSVKEVADNSKSNIGKIFKDFLKKDKQVRNEIRENLEKIINGNLEKGKHSTKKIVKKFKKFISSGNYKKLKDIIISKDLTYFEDYNKQLRVKTAKSGEKNDKKRENKYIKEGAEYTILTNGTTDIWNTKKDSIQKKLADKYYLTQNEELDSETAAKEYASILKSNDYKFFNWIGDNILDSKSPFFKETMTTKADEIFNWIKAKAPSSVNLIGHSHGGNIMVLVINKLYNKGYDVENMVFNLITLSSPVRADIQIDKNIAEKIYHTEFFSKKDFVQNTGFIDNTDYGSLLVFSLITSFFGLIPTLCGGFGLHNFKYASNRVDITNFIEKAKGPNNVDKIFSKINSELKTIDNEKCPFKYHQATRSVKLFNDLLEENGMK